MIDRERGDEINGASLEFSLFLQLFVNLINVIDHLVPDRSTLFLGLPFPDQQDSPIRLKGGDPEPRGMLGYSPHYRLSVGFHFPHLQSTSISFVKLHVPLWDEIYAINHKERLFW